MHQQSLVKFLSLIPLPTRKCWQWGTFLSLILLLKHPGNL